MKGRSVVFLSMVLVALAVFLAGCPADDDETTTTAPGADTTGTTAAGPVGTVTVLGVWGGPELEGFQAVASEWEQATGGRMQFEGTRDLSAILRARVSGNNPPDIAVLPNPALLQEFAAAGNLRPVDEMLDMDQLQGDYAETWIQQGSMDGSLYGLFVKASGKSTIWYDPKQFEANNWELPDSFDNLLALSDQIVQEGKNPWALGLESGAASGWPGSDWIQEILLHESGPDVYDQWVSHEIPWTDPQVKSAFEKFGRIVHTENYVAGGAQAVVNTGFQDASYQPFQDPPRGYMYFLGAFTEGFLAAQFPDKQPGTDYDFFAFPEIAADFADSVTGGGDVMVAFNDTPGVRSFLQYMADGANWEPWAQRGGFTTPSKALPADAYPSDLIAKTAEQLTESEIFRFDADDSMPSEVQQAFWRGILDYVQNAGALDGVLQQIEEVAAGAYEQ